MDRVKVRKRASLVEARRRAHRSQGDLQGTKVSSTHALSEGRWCTYDNGYDRNAHRDHDSVHIPPPPCVVVAPLFEFAYSSLNAGPSRGLFIRGRLRWKREEGGDEPSWESTLAGVDEDRISISVSYPVETRIPGRMNRPERSFVQKTAPSWNPWMAPSTYFADCPVLCPDADAVTTYWSVDRTAAAPPP